MPKNLNDIQLAARPVGIGRQPKRPAVFVKGQLDGPGRIVGIIRGKFLGVSAARDIQKDHAVIDGQGRKFDQMNNGRSVLAHAGNQTVGRDLLMTAGNRQYHAPMAAENVRMPRSAAFGLKPFRMRRAQRPQVGKSREYYAFFESAPPAGILPDDGANQRPILLRTDRHSGGIEAGVEKKLPRRTHHYKAPVRIGWFCLPAMKGHPAR